MREVKVTRWQADDGKFFESENECFLYEGKEYLKRLRLYCDNRGECDGCIFWKDGCGCIVKDTPDNWSTHYL